MTTIENELDDGSRTDACPCIWSPEGSTTTMTERERKELDERSWCMYHESRATIMAANASINVNGKKIDGSEERTNILFPRICFSRALSYTLFHLSPDRPIAMTCIYNEQCRTGQTVIPSFSLLLSLSLAFCLSVYRSLPLPPFR